MLSSSMIYIFHAIQITYIYVTITMQQKITGNRSLAVPNVGLVDNLLFNLAHDKF